MPAVLYGTNLVPVIIDPTGNALRTTLKPLEYSYPGYVGGHYRIGIPLTGGLTTSISASSPLVAFRWAPTTNSLLAIIKKISVTFGVKTAGSTAAIIVSMDVIRATAFTVQDTGGTNVTFGLTQRLRGNMGISQAAIQYANGSTALSAGTRTLDANPFGGTLIDEQPAAGVVRSMPVVEMLKEDTQSGHGLTLANNEGFIIRSGTAAWTSTSLVVDIFATIEWTETFQY